jgi:lysophospholipase L1-like esterase
MGKGREWVLAAGTAVICGVVLAAAEAGLRWGRPTFLEGRPVASPVVYSSLYGWELRRSWRGLDLSGAPITLDGEGRRVTPRPAPGRAARRVVMLGDSIAFGTGVGDRQTFAHRLVELDPGLEVANLAVPGYGTDQALLRLEHEAARLRPEVVVLHFCVANDFVDNTLPYFLYDPRRPKPFFTLESGELTRHDAHLRLPWRVRLASALREHSFLINALSAGGPRADALEEGHWQQREKRALRGLEAAAALTAREIERLDAVSRGCGARLVVLVHPDRAAFEGESDLAERALAAARGVRALDLRHEYLALDLGFRDVALDGVGHLTPRGHELVARALHREIAGQPIP